MAQVPELQTAEPFAAGVGQETQVGPQALVLVSGWQMLLQRWVPDGHIPLQGVEIEMQAPAHSLVCGGQLGTHDRPSQVTEPPPVGATQALHEVESFGPQVAIALLSTHLPPQMWKPVLHLTAHTPLEQTAMPLVSVGQETQVVPHPVASSSGAQRAFAPVPHRCVPTPQVKLQVVPLQLVELAPGGLGQDVHDVPQLSMLVFDAQRPVQSCVPVSHTPEHEAALSMHVPVHSFIPDGQFGTHAVPLQVASPPVGFWQGLHDVVPQLPTSLLLTHLAPQMW
jgi:hypothetical protein